MVWTATSFSPGEEARNIAAVIRGPDALERAFLIQPGQPAVARHVDGNASPESLSS
jgi:hypothetical protein